MSTGRQLSIALALTPDAELLPAVRMLVGRLAEQMQFSESQRVNLQRAVGQACQYAMEKGSDAADVALQFSGYADRLEIAFEDAGAVGEEESYLLNQWLDQVVLEETEDGKVRLTLVEYLSRVGSQP